MRFWDWMLEVYDRPGTPHLCLRLQDEHGQSICLLLWAYWSGKVDQAVLGRAVGIVDQWEATVLGPIRQVRSGLKVPLTGVGAAARLSLREEVKAIELRAERLLAETLESLADPCVAHGGGLAAMKRASAAWKREAPGETLAALAQALR